MSLKQAYRRAMRTSLSALALAFVATSLCIPLLATAAAPADAYVTRVAKVLKATPLIDGHNDWAFGIREYEDHQRWLTDVDLHDLSGRPHFHHTDINRLREGLVGGTFWSVYVPADLPEVEQVKATLDQIDIVRQFVARYPETFELARTAADVRRIHRTGRIASLMGAEGGGQIDNDLGVLRTYHDLGVGYLTLTHVKNVTWADSSNEDPRHGGLTPFGKIVVHELNRLGMLVDISHVSTAVMKDAIATSKAPVFFSHSSARALTHHPRNVPDDVLRLVAANGGVVMVNAYPLYVSEPLRQWMADHGGAQARLEALDLGNPGQFKADLAAWEQAHPKPEATLEQVADHIEHIAKVAGKDHVCIGADFWGDPGPKGFEDVSRYPALLAELMRRGWSDADIAKLAGENVLRVMEAAEKVAASMKGELPSNASQPETDRG